MIDLKSQQARFLKARSEQLARETELYNAAQSLQLVADEIAAQLQVTGRQELPATDPLKIKEATIAAAIPNLQKEVELAGREVERLFEELYAQPDLPPLLSQLPGDIPFLLFPVRMETRFCRTRHFAKPVEKEWLLDFKNSNFPTLVGWGLQRSR